MFKRQMHRWQGSPRFTLLCHRILLGWAPRSVTTENATEPLELTDPTQDSGVAVRVIICTATPELAAIC